MIGATIEERVPMIKTLRHRSFALLWSGQFISFLGDGIFRVALAWTVLQLTGSALAMGTVFFAGLVPTILFTLLGGVAADRISRRLLMLWSDMGRAVVVALVAGLAWLHLLQFWHLLALSLLFGIADSFFTPSYQSIMPQLVPVDLLQSANSLNRLSTLLSRIAGPSLGALCVAVAGGPVSAFALDALSFWVSVSCLLVLRLPSAEPAVPREGGQSLAIHNLLLDIRDGLRYVKKTTWLWVTIIVAAVSNVTFMVPLAVSLPRLVHDVYGAGPWLYGILVAADGAGAIVAAIGLSQLPHLRRRGLLAYGCLLISFLSLTVLGLPLPRANEPIVATLACIFAGFGLGIFEILEMTFLQENVPEDKLGRVFSVDMCGSYLLIPLGLLLVGALTDRIGPAVIFVIGGMLSLILALAALLVRDIRELK